MRSESFAQRSQHAPQGGQVHVAANAHLPSVAQFDLDQAGGGGRARGSGWARRGWRWHRCRCRRRVDHVHRHEDRRLRRGQHTLAHLPPPGEQQALADAVSCRDGADRSASLVRLRHQTELLRRAPPTTALPTRDDLDHPVHPHTSSADLNSYLKRRSTSHPGGLRRRVTSRRRVGWCEFSARLLRPLCRRCSTPGISSFLAAGELASLSVTMTRGGRPCLFSSLRSRRSAGLSSRRLCPSTSSTSPSWATARHNQCFLPAILIWTSSRCHLSPGRGSRRRISFAKPWPNLRAHWRTVSWLTVMPRAASSSSTIRRASGKRK